MCTTSRWFIFGETGIGKTLIAMEMAAAIAVAAEFLIWPGQRRVRVMHLDGELPMETFKIATARILNSMATTVKTSTTTGCHR